ncbi:hypothetical protein ACGFMK_27000 [Amycolatopsis sp. NPDC049252]
MRLGMAGYDEELGNSGAAAAAAILSDVDAIVDGLGERWNCR